MVELLKQLIEIPSVSTEEAPLVEFFAAKLSSFFPGAVKVQDRNIIVDLGPRTESRTLLFCSHIDTVGPANGWTRPPFKATEENGRIYGLGANDALASVVAMTEAAKHSVSTLQGRLLLAFVCEEELGGNGFFKIEPELPRYDFAVFGEPTRMQIGHTMRGAMHLKMISRGRSCHASRPQEGQNAIQCAMQDLQKIFSLDLKDNSPWGGASLQPTIIKGGVSRNQIPDLVETNLDVRPTTDVHNELILERLRRAGIEFEIVANRRRPVSCPADSPLLAAARRALPQAELYAFGGTCDMAFSSAPSLVIGPGASERSHAADEFITRDELLAGAAGYQRIIVEVLNS